MYEYIIFIFLISFLLFFVKKGKLQLIDIIIIVIMSVFAGIRKGIGTDYDLYKNMYENINVISSSIYRTGIGYYYISIFLHNILNLNFETVTIIFSFITNTLIYCYIKNKSDNVGQSVFLYITLGFFMDQFNIMRQMLSFSLILYSLLLFDNKKNVKAIILATSGILVHTMNIFILLIYFLNKKFIKRKIKTSYIIIIGIILLLLFNPLYRFITTNISQLNIYSTDTEMFEAGIGTYLRVMFYILLMLLINTFSKNCINKNKKNIEYINQYYIGVAILLPSINNVMFARVAQQLLFNCVIIIPNIFTSININKNTKLLIEFISIIIFVSYFILYITNFGEVIPYTTIFN